MSQHPQKDIAPPSRSSWRRRFVPLRFGGNYTPLLGALVLLYALAPLLDDRAWSRRVLDVLFYAVVLLGARGATSRRPHLLLIAGLAGMGAGAAVLSDWLEWHALAVVGDLGNAVLLMGLCVLILSDVLRHPRVTADTIVGSLCVYVLISLMAAFGYLVVATTDGDAFRGLSPRSNRLGELLYFSVTTLTTLGYGDITPVAPLARALATLEALAGQLYLVVLVAYLVGLRLTQPPTSSG